MTYKLSIPVNDLKGNPIAGSNMAELIANALCGGNSGQPAKAIAIAMKLIETGVMDVGENDLALVKNAVLSSGLINDLAKDRILKALESTSSPS